MFRYKRTVFLKDTDATGAVYFPKVFSLVVEAIESFFSAQSVPLAKMLVEGEFHLPIVHAQGDFHAPIVLGDSIEVELTIGKIGLSSFTTDAKIYKEQRELATISLVQVAMSQVTKQSIPLPEQLLSALSLLCIR